MSPPSVCAAILTTARPDLLERTLEASLEVLMNCSRIIVLNNGNDAATNRVLDRFQLSLVSESTPQRLPNGDAMSLLMKLVGAAGYDLCFFLEEDWGLSPELADSVPDWWPRACALAMVPIVGQVRLRRATDLAICSPTNWVDGRPALWTKLPGEPAMIGNAHWTQNPSLVRTEILYGEENPGEPIAGVYPAVNERHAMARFGAFNLSVVQMLPGLYDHSGWGRSTEGHDPR